MLGQQQTTIPATSDSIVQTLDDAATITWDARSGSIARVTLAGSRTFANITNLAPGSYILYVKQDGTGSHTLTWGDQYKWVGGTAPTLTTTGDALDIISFVYDGVDLVGVACLNFS